MIYRVVFPPPEQNRLRAAQPLICSFRWSVDRIDRYAQSRRRYDILYIYLAEKWGFPIAKHPWLANKRRV